MAEVTPDKSIALEINQSSLLFPYPFIYALSFGFPKEEYPQTVEPVTL